MMTKDKYCRICTDKIADEDYKSTGACNLPLLMKLYLPEVVTELADSVICLRCFSVLQLFHNLRSKALKAETKVQNYAGTVPGSKKKTVTMADVLCEKEREIQLEVKKDSAEDIIVTIDDSSGDDEDEEMMAVEEVIVKEDNDLELEVKCESDELDSEV